MLERVATVDRPAQPAVAEWLEARKSIFVWWAASRTLVFTAVFGLHLANAPRGYFGTGIFRPLFGPLESWDGVWYRLIAVHGYLLVPGRQSDPAFFPLYPLVLKLVGATGIPVAVAGVLL